MRPDLEFRSLEGDFFVYDPRADRIHRLNASAALVLDLCDGARSKGEIVRAVARETGSEFGVLEEQVHGAISALSRANLLVGTDAAQRVGRL